MMTLSDKVYVMNYDVDVWIYNFEDISPKTSILNLD